MEAFSHSELAARPLPHAGSPGRELRDAESGPRVLYLRTYAVGAGATTALIAGAFVVFLSLAAFVAFKGLPLGESGDEAGAAFLGSNSGSVPAAAGGGPDGVLADPARGARAGVPGADFSGSGGSNGPGGGRSEGPGGGSNGPGGGSNGPGPGGGAPGPGVGSPGPGGAPGPGGGAPGPGPGSPLPGVPSIPTPPSTPSPGGNALDDPVGTVGGTAGNTLDQVGGTAGNTLDQVDGTARNTLNEVGGTVGEPLLGNKAAGAVDDTAGAVDDTAGDTLNEVGSAVGTTPQLG